MRRHSLLPNRQHLLAVVSQMQAFREKLTFACLPSLPAYEYIYSAAATSATFYTDIKIQLLQPSHVD